MAREAPTECSEADLCRGNGVPPASTRCRGTTKAVPALSPGLGGCGQGFKPLGNLKRSPAYLFVGIAKEFPDAP
jgi:hypothetical protein